MDEDEIDEGEMDDEEFDEDELTELEAFDLWMTEAAQDDSADELTPAGADRDIPAESIELEKIPRRLWEATLAPLYRQTRTYIARQVRDPALREIASGLAIELDLAESERAIERQKERNRARRRGAPLPAPGAEHGAARPTVQVNVRLRADDHARLRRAARAVGLRPTTLARALMLNGVTMILREHPELAREHPELAA